MGDEQLFIKSINVVIGSLREVVWSQLLRNWVPCEDICILFFGQWGTIEDF